MILKNYWKWLDAVTRIRQYYSGNNNGENFGVVGTSGSVINIFLGFAGVQQQVIDHSNYNTVFSPLETIISNGNEAISGDTYTLQDDITSNFINISTIVSVSTNDNYSKTITTTGTNNSSNPITIRRIGYAKNFYQGGINIDTRNMALLGIAELDEPLVVGVGDSFAITTEWVEQ